jgi:hypothetical protein
VDVAAVRDDKRCRDELVEVGEVLLQLRLNYPDRKLPFWAVKRSATPYKSAIQNRFTMENAKAA